VAHDGAHRDATDTVDPGSGSRAADAGELETPVVESIGSDAGARFTGRIPELRIEVT
jgi:hypothetical protein